jgi:hypothetical protein
LVEVKVAMLAHVVDQSKKTCLKYFQISNLYLLVHVELFVFDEFVAVAVKSEA